MWGAWRFWKSSLSRTRTSDKPEHRAELRPQTSGFGGSDRHALQHASLLAGEVSGLQIDRVVRLVEHADPAQLRVVVVHQPVAVTRGEDEPNRLRGHAAALQRWAEAGADLVMGGHIHLPYVMLLQGLARPLWVVQAGTAVSSRVRDGVPNSVNLLRWGADAAPGCCQIEQWDYRDDDRAFRLAKASEFRPDRT